MDIPGECRQIGHGSVTLCEDVKMPRWVVWGKDVSWYGLGLVTLFYLPLALANSDPVVTELQTQKFSIPQGEGKPPVEFDTQVTVLEVKDAKQRGDVDKLADAVSQKLQEVRKDFGDKTKFEFVLLPPSQGENDKIDPYILERNRVDKVRVAMVEKFDELEQTSLFKKIPNLDRLRQFVLSQLETPEETKRRIALEQLRGTLGAKSHVYKIIRGDLSKLPHGLRKAIEPAFAQFGEATKGRALSAGQAVYIFESDWDSYQIVLRREVIDSYQSPEISNVSKYSLPTDEQSSDHYAPEVLAVDLTGDAPLKPKLSDLQYEIAKEIADRGDQLPRKSVISFALLPDTKPKNSPNYRDLPEIQLARHIGAQENAVMVDSGNLEAIPPEYREVLGPAITALNESTGGKVNAPGSRLLVFQTNKDSLKYLEEHNKKVPSNKTAILIRFTAITGATFLVGYFLDSQPLPLRVLIPMTVAAGSMSALLQWQNEGYLKFLSMHGVPPSDFKPNPRWETWLKHFSTEGTYTFLYNLIGVASERLTMSQPGYVYRRKIWSKSIPLATLGAVLTEGTLYNDIGHATEKLLARVPHDENYEANVHKIRTASAYSVAALSGLTTGVTYLNLRFIDRKAYASYVALTGTVCLIGMLVHYLITHDYDLPVYEFVGDTYRQLAPPISSTARAIREWIHPPRKLGDPTAEAAQTSGD